MIRFADLEDPKVISKFVKKVAFGSPTECWNWLGGRKKGWNGQLLYGEIRIPLMDKDIGAHQASFVLYNHSNIPDGMYIRHTCDNPSCVNPAHLKLSTPKQNTQDMIEKKRWKVNNQARGERQWKSKLTDDQVREIRARYIKGNRYLKGIPASKGNRKELAKEFGISVSEFAKIVQGLTWRHLL